LKEFVLEKDVVVFAESVQEAEKIHETTQEILVEFRNWPRKKWIVRHEVKVRNLVGYNAFIDERSRKVSDEDLGIKRYYCYTCEKYISSKEVRRHIKRNHEVLRISDPLKAPITEQDDNPIWDSSHGKGVSQGLENAKCFYCGRTEKLEFPLIAKEIGEGIRVKICPICYYQRFGRYHGKNDKVLEIQKNFVISLKRTEYGRKELARIHNEIREELKRKIELYLRARISPNQARFLEHLVEKRLAKLLPRYVL